MENKPIPIAFNVTHQRVDHYTDVIEALVRIELSRCQQEKFTPTRSQIEFFRKELARYIIIRRDLDTANSLRISKSSIIYG